MKIGRTLGTRKMTIMSNTANKAQKGTSEDKEKDKTAKGQEYRFVEDFGEQLVGKHQTVIVIYDLVTDELKVLPRKKSFLSKGI